MEMSNRIFESSPVAVLVVDRDGCVTGVNSQAERTFGYNWNELIGEAVEILIPLRFAAHHVEHRSRFLAHPLPRSRGEVLKLFGRRKDGTEFPAEISLSSLRTDEGLLVSAAVRDISARKRAERRMAAEYALRRAVLEGTALPLGLGPGDNFPAGPLTILQAGDLVFLLTDGVAETMSSGGRSSIPCVRWRWFARTGTKGLRRSSSRCFARCASSPGTQSRQMTSRRWSFGSQTLVDVLGRIRASKP